MALSELMLKVADMRYRISLCSIEKLKLEGLVDKAGDIVDKIVSILRMIQN